MARQKNKAASVRQLLLDRSLKNSESFQFLLTRYGLERLLYRLSLSEYEPYFVLKGAMLFPIWGINGHRPTMDADLLGFGENTEVHVREVFQELCHLDVEDDGLLFAPENIRVDVIREEMEYGGVRVKLIAELDKARIPPADRHRLWRRGDASRPGDRISHPFGYAGATSSCLSS
ncbi:nucleotidyl transferase AbiEii/AbiGii toxin family protein [Desulfobulbus elongatus]|uniref:nucleotidyl transferase AbiEii/AbiGii toxin family protein n=1 Tax=Desulfobulbus elongatus TaxID=53332 RepID=UPI0012F912D2|nr:nucleotidyl transferase AbiEii/AbiGii toxin family protein [Desulfobulbus elongatus]